MNWTKQSDGNINFINQGDQCLIYTIAGEKLYTTAGEVIGVACSDSINLTKQSDGSINLTKQSDGSINFTKQSDGSINWTKQT